MSMTTHYNLYITQQTDNPRFVDWRTDLCGDTDSNMTKIDDALYGKIDNPELKSGGQVLTYDSDTGAWIAATPSGGDVQSINGVAPDGSGNVVLAKGDLALENIDNTADVDKPVSTAVQAALDGKSNMGHSHDASSITSGIIDIARIPAAALERCIIVADQTARFALVSSDVQLGDTVKQNDTGIMYMVKDITNLSSESGYMTYAAGSAASVPWSGVTGKPTIETSLTDDDTKIPSSGAVIDYVASVIGAAIGGSY